MQRYFGSIVNNTVILSKDDIFHIKKVMRMKVGELLEVVSDKKVYLTELKSLEPLEIVVKEEISENSGLPSTLSLIFAPLKGDHFDLVLQKATELGVSKIYIVNTTRTVKNISKELFENKKERLLKILKEASEQSKRNTIPELFHLSSFNDIKSVEADHKMIAYEDFKGNTSSFIDIINSVKADESLAIIIGPEGGFDPSEVKYANSLGYKCVSLGKRILRAETASIYAISVIGALLER